MSAIKRLVRGFYRLLLPTAILLIVALIGSAVWLVHKSTGSPKAPYLLTPDKYGLLSTRAAKVTDETWNNADGTSSRGWLLRGTEGAPAVLLLHKYGADRSWVLNLGVKLNEGTDFTVLMPDLRGHGEMPLTPVTSFGGRESQDVQSAFNFLKSLKSEGGNALVGPSFGIYGVELGAFAGISAAAKEVSFKAIVADSVPYGSNAILRDAIAKRYPFMSSVTSRIAELGTIGYFFDGTYDRQLTCDYAKSLRDRKVLLLASTETVELQTSTSNVAACFPDQSAVEKKLDLMPSGYNINNATNDQSATYDLRVIDFFKKSLQ